MSGQAIAQVARRLDITTDTVRLWRRRFLERRLDGLCDEPRPGVPRKIADADVERVIVKALEEIPKDATDWSTRSMAAATGMSQSTVSRIWRAFALQPHRAERSQIPALDRSQPVLPMMPGVPERRSHDYVRAGTTTLFAALDTTTVEVIGSLRRRHRAVEFRKFLAELDTEVAVVCRTHRERAPPWRTPLRPGPRTRHPGLARRLERPSTTVRLGENRRRHPRQSRRLLPPNL